MGYDVTNKESFEDVKNFWYPKSKGLSGSDIKYLLENKIDLADNRCVSETEARKYAEDSHLRYFEISCLNTKGIKEFIGDLVNELIKR